MMCTFNINFQFINTYYKMQLAAQLTLLCMNCYKHLEILDDLHVVDKG